MATSQYKVLVALDVYRAILALGSAERRRILGFLDQLASDPYGHAHYQEPDEEGHSRDVAIVIRHAITYWIDSGDRHVKVLRIEPAGN